MPLDLDSVLNDVLNIVKVHNKWRRLETINLIPSENVMSPLAEYIYLNDMEADTLKARWVVGITKELSTSISLRVSSQT